MFSKILQSYLKFWATVYLKRVSPKIIAITGSVGKTSTKEAIFAVLQQKFGLKVRKSSGNLNTKNGVCLSVLGISASPEKFWQWPTILFLVPIKAFAHQKSEYLVLEIAADQPGDIKFIMDFIKPSISVITAIGPAHLEIFGTIEKIIEEKAEILKNLKSEDWAVFNIDDVNVRKASYGGRWQKKTYGIKERADIIAYDIKNSLENYKPKTSFKIKINSEIVPIDLALPGSKGNIYAFLAAFAVGDILGLKYSEITKGLQEVKNEKHRVNFFEGKNGATVIDDAYNANPLSMIAALELLEQTPGSRKFVVLGGMAEIGKITKQAHIDINAIAQKIADEVITVGDLAKNYNAKKHFKTINQVATYLLKNTGKNDIILLKGSNSSGVFRIADALKN